MEILILGGSGQIGMEIQRCVWPEDVTIYAPRREQFDLRDETAVACAVSARNWAAVINAAAYTAVDKAQTDIVAAWRLNALMPAILAAETARMSIPLVQISTDYVFDGTADRPYVESDPVGPLSVYGASKEAGEQAVRSGNPRHVIVRTAWVVSSHGNNFVKTMLRLASERDRLGVVHDQLGCPTSAADLAVVLAAIALRLAQNPDAPSGTYHAVNLGETTWCEFAREIMAQAAQRGARTSPVDAISTADFPTPAKRPANSRLSTDKLAHDYGLSFRPWQAALSPILDQLVGCASSNLKPNLTAQVTSASEWTSPIRRGCAT
jgi:dTDP-4-dehydrorhamnose reductase